MLHCIVVAVRHCKARFNLQVALQKPQTRSGSEIEADLSDRDVHKLRVIAPSAHNPAVLPHRDGETVSSEREYSSLITDGLRVLQEQERGGRGSGKAAPRGIAGRRPEFHGGSSPVTRPVRCLRDFSVFMASVAERREQLVNVYADVCKVNDVGVLWCDAVGPCHPAGR